MASTDTDTGTVVRKNRIPAVIFFIGSGLIPIAPRAQGISINSIATPVMPNLAAADTESTRPFQFLPGVRFAASASSNVLRKVEAESGMTAEISPFADALINTPRAQAKASLIVRNFIRSQGDNFDPLRYDFAGSGNFAIVDDWLGIRTRAFVRDVSNSPFGSVVFDQSATATNRIRISSLTVNPYLIGNLGTTAQYSAQYTGTSSHAEGRPTALAKFDHQIHATIGSPRNAGPLGWSLNSFVQERAFSGGLRLGRQSHSASASLRLGTNLTLGGSLAYDRIDQLKGSNGRDHGFAPGAFVNWNPFPTTSFSAQLSNTYYGTTGRLQLTQRASQWIFGLTYTDQVFTSVDGSILTVDPAAIFSGSATTPVGNPAYQALVSQLANRDGSIPITAGVLNEAVVLDRRLYASIAYSQGRSSAILSLFQAKRTSRFAADALGLSSPSDTQPLSLTLVDLVQRGISARTSVSVGARTTLTVDFGVQNNSIQSESTSSRISHVNASVVTQLDRHLNTVIGARRWVQSAKGGTAIPFDENIIYGSVDVKF